MGTAVLADGGKEPVEQPKVDAAPLGANGIAAQVGEVAFQQGPVDLVDPLEVDAGEEPGEPGDYDIRPAASLEA